MSPYNESVSVIDTPFAASEDWDLWDEESSTLYGSQFSVQSRMFVILAVVSMIVVGFSLFAIPRNIGAAPVDMNVAAVSENPVNQQVEEITAVEPAVESAVAVTGSISPIFTAEVQHWENQIVKWSAAHDLDPNIVATIMQIESCGNPEAVSIAGARGLFQVMPFHFSGGEDMMDPDTNARRGLNFYNEQLRYTNDDKLLSFAGYNGGYAASGGNYANWPDETKRYHTWAKGIYEDAISGATTSETLDAWLAAGGAAGCNIAASQLNIN